MIFGKWTSLGALLAVALATPALAQDRAENAGSAGIARHTLRPVDSAARRTEPFSTKGRLPLADASVFDRISRNAATEFPAGRTWFSASSPDGKKVFSASREDIEQPQAYGETKSPYTTVRAAVTTLQKPRTAAESPVTSYPYRATGKLEMRFGSDWFVCTGTMVSPGVVLTAAHCVFNFGEGQSGFTEEVLFYPANFSGQLGKAYGTYSAKAVFVPEPYFDGTDTCDPQAQGVVCNNDIATVVLNPRGGEEAGNVVGWQSYATGGYSFIKSPPLKNVVAGQITQLGYPAAFDQGLQMQRTDAVGWLYNAGDLKNTQIGSAQTGGSSGGPWLVNFGTVPDVNPNGASLGHETVMAIVGVTSYGYTQVGLNQQGASFFGQNKEFPAKKYGKFGAGNVGKLMLDTCTDYPTSC
jgi:V8-like Glu-specific endopeptidase